MGNRRGALHEIPHSKGVATSRPGRTVSDARSHLASGAPYGVARAARFRRRLGGLLAGHHASARHSDVNGPIYPLAARARDRVARVSSRASGTGIVAHDSTRRTDTRDRLRRSPIFSACKYGGQENRLFQHILVCECLPCSLTATALRCQCEPVSRLIWLLTSRDRRVRSRRTTRGERQ